MVQAYGCIVLEAFLDVILLCGNLYTLLSRLSWLLEEHILVAVDIKFSVVVNKSNSTLNESSVNLQ